MQFLTVSRCAFPFTEVEAAAHPSGPAQARVWRCGDPSLAPLASVLLSLEQAAFCFHHGQAIAAPHTCGFVFPLWARGESRGTWCLDKERQHLLLLILDTLCSC